MEGEEDEFDGGLAGLKFVSHIAPSCVRKPFLFGERTDASGELLLEIVGFGVFFLLQILPARGPVARQAS